MSVSSRPSALLAIECSTSSASVALLRTDRAVLLETGEGGAAVSSGLLAMVERLIDRAGLQRHQIDAFAFGAGPGSFMGVRTAAAIAQGLAVARDLPVQPVGTLEALAWRASRRGTVPGRYAVVVDARMGEVYHAIHEQSSNGWIQQSAPAVEPPALAMSHWLEAGFDSTTVVVGLPACLALPALQPSLVANIDASMIGEAALDHWIGGDPAMALPVYVRDRVAATLAERALAKAA